MPAGPIYDLDASSSAGRIQVLQNAPGPSTTWTTDPRVISVARAGYASARIVDIQPDATGEIKTIKLLPSQPPPPAPPPSRVPPPAPPPGPGEHRVDDITYDTATGAYTVHFVDDTGAVSRGTDPVGVAQAVIDCAVAAGENVEYLTIDPATGDIARVKVNAG